MLPLSSFTQSRLRQGLMMTDDSYMPLFTQPLTLTLLIVSVVLLFWPLIRSWRMARR